MPSAELIAFFRCPSEALPDVVPSETELASLQEAGVAVPTGEDVVASLRAEHYALHDRPRRRSLLESEGLKGVYYSIRPWLSQGLRELLQRTYLSDWKNLSFPRWPVDTTVEEVLEERLAAALRAAGPNARIPFVWFWPDGATAAAMMTHDVETDVGVAGLQQLIQTDASFGVRSSFQLVPEERYNVTRELRDQIRAAGCEVNVHGLNHNGNPYKDRETFQQQVGRINHYIREFEAEGFRAGCMYRNMDWYGEFQFQYDMSVPTVAHLEPQRGGCCTVFPFFIGNIVELPLTTTQDYSLFFILKDYSLTLWKQQIAKIIQHNGLISFIAHPDYLGGDKELSVYRQLLTLIGELRSQGVWVTLPGEIQHWWRQRAEMRIVSLNGKWQIEGKGCERARISLASIEDGRLVYSSPESSCDTDVVTPGFVRT